MDEASHNVRERSVAVLASLQAGIEPAFLVLLAARGSILPESNGWIVGAGQGGMILGALLCWRWTEASRPSVALVAAGIGAAATLGLAVAGDLGTIVALRLLLGSAMGLLLTRATSAATRERPHRALGLIVVAQQLLATAVMALLPLVAAAWGASCALASLAAVPLAIAVLNRPHRSAPTRARVRVTGQETAHPGAAERWILVLVTSVIFMIWSYIAAIGQVMGLGGEGIDAAIALCSLASAPAAGFAAIAPPRHDRRLTLLCCGLAILAPTMLSATAGMRSYIAAMISFNAGSAYALVRFSGWAMESGIHGRGRRLVVLSQCGATAGGAVLGAIAIAIDGLFALRVLGAVLVAVAVATMLYARSERSACQAELQTALK